MQKIKYSNFELLKDIFEDMDLRSDKFDADNTKMLEVIWKEIVGDKISAYSKVEGLSSNNILKIVCSDSYAANELYYEKEKLIELMNKKTVKTGIEIKDIKFNYKKWETNDEK